jgi:hypothetical protein
LSPFLVRSPWIASLKRAVPKGRGISNGRTGSADIEDKASLRKDSSWQVVNKRRLLQRSRPRF